MQRMLNDVGRALVEAIAASTDVAAAVRRMRHEGYALNLILDCQQDGSASAKVALGAPTRQEPSPRDAAFRLDGRDVSLLRSLGIDPTRPAPRRRGG